MYNDAWDDYYDHREDAREDWQDHREDLVDERGDRAENRSENSGPIVAGDDAGAAHGSSRDATGEPARRRRRRRAQASAPRRQTATRQTRSVPDRTGSTEARGYGDGSSSQTQGRLNGAAAAPTRSRAIRAESRSARRVLADSSSRGSSRGGGGRRRRAVYAMAIMNGIVTATSNARHSSIVVPRAAASHSPRCWLASRSRPSQPAQRTFADARRRRQGAHRRGQGREPRRAAGDLRPRWARSLIASSDPATARMNRRGVRRRRCRSSGISRTTAPNRKTLVIGNEEWPFPVPLVEGRGRMAIRHRRRQGRSAGAADRPQRAGRDRDLPRLRHGAAALRAAGTRRQARGRATRRSSRAIPARRTACIGRRRAARSGVRLVTWWRRRRRKAVRSARIARSRRPFTVTTSRS